MSYGLGHDGGVNNDFVGTAGFEHAAFACCINAHHQQRLHPFFTNALSPARQARGVYGAAGLQIRLAREVLPIRIPPLILGPSNTSTKCARNMLQIT
jgi:hypothetical protein